MKSKNALLALLAMILIIPALVFAQSGFGQPQIGSVEGRMRILNRVRVLNFGNLIYEGRMDINPTINRIRQGTKLNHNNDGSIFGNFERRLPIQTDSQYYREFVHQMNGFPFPGPQRVVIGKKGEVFYTGDHYASFWRLR
jgi:hypothetical protein